MDKSADLEIVIFAEQLLHHYLEEEQAEDCAICGLELSQTHEPQKLVQIWLIRYFRAS